MIFLSITLYASWLGLGFLLVWLFFKPRKQHIPTKNHLAVHRVQSSNSEQLSAASMKVPLSSKGQYKGCWWPVPRTSHFAPGTWTLHLLVMLPPKYKRRKYNLRTEHGGIWKRATFAKSLSKHKLRFRHHTHCAAGKELWSSGFSEESSWHHQQGKDILTLTLIRSSPSD